jgi:DNA-binding MarR family transcriptional regulator
VTGLSDDPTYATFARLVRVQTRLWNDVDARLRAEHGVALALVTPLELVAREPDRRVQDVADTLHITVGGASKVVDRLVAAGLVTRAAHPTDRRSSVLAPTDEGLALLGRVAATVEAVLADRLVAPLSRAGLHELDRLLTTVQDAVPDDPEESS